MAAKALMPERNPAVAGELEVFEDLGSLETQLRATHPPSGFEAAGVLRAPDTLIADGTALHVPLNPRFAHGDLCIYRPFAGISVASLTCVVENPVLLKQVCTALPPCNKEVIVRLIHHGSIAYCFGKSRLASDEVQGLVSCYPATGDFHYEVVKGEALTITGIGITEEGEREVWHRLGVPPPPMLAQLRSASAAEAKARPLPKEPAFVNLSASFCNLPDSGFAHAAMLRLKIGELFILLGEDGAGGRRRPPWYGPVPFTEARKLSQARAILEASIEDPPPIKQLATLVGLNRRKLTEGFKKVFNETVASYSLELRMRRGHQLLTDSDLSVAAIAEVCGYEHPENFTLAFRRRFGCSPSQARNAG